MIQKLLIANRGEIACRILGTAKRLGMRTVAVYSHADRGALHTELAGEAVCIGAAPARESYLRADAIIEAARATGADAVHPGYGFLAENPEFAEACANAGLIFVGPPPAAIRAMGEKAAALRLMDAAGIPVLPGYHAAEQSDQALCEAAAHIGFPLMIKPSAGGGGKGMRVVQQADEFQHAVDAARREAAAAFGDDTLLLERFLESPRHVEVQVFADVHGNAVHLFDRDCSVQRRHQKIIEEAPAPGLGDALRKRMAEVAIHVARSIDYVGAGTVEFLVESAPAASPASGSTGAAPGFYFMEMNTRLQVEHAVTEMVCGQDLVEWQLRVAAREALPAAQGALHTTGHAIEARVYAEDPDSAFLPATGTLTALAFPDHGAALRVDRGVRTGDNIGIHYDPLIAKIVVWGRDREQASRHLRDALARTHAGGVATNLDFLGRVAAHPAFNAGPTDTHMIERHAATLLPGHTPPDDILLLAIAHLVHGASPADVPEDPPGTSPWNSLRGWRLNAAGHEVFSFEAGTERLEVDVEHATRSLRVRLPSGTVEVRHARGPDGGIRVSRTDRQIHGRVFAHGPVLVVSAACGRWTLRLETPARARRATPVSAGHLTSPMPGTVVAVLIAPGERVESGQPLVIVEAMKMEHTVSAPYAGIIEAVCYQAGDLVEEGAELIRMRDQS